MLTEIDPEQLRGLLIEEAAKHPHGTGSQDLIRGATQPYQRKLLRSAKRLATSLLEVLKREGVFKRTLNGLIVLALQPPNIPSEQRETKRPLA